MVPRKELPTRSDGEAVADRRLVDDDRGLLRIALQLLPQAAQDLEADVQSIASESSSWVPGYLQRFGDL